MSLWAGATRLAGGYSCTPCFFTSRGTKIPEQDIERRAVAEIYFVFRGTGKIAEKLVINVCYFWYKKERRAPAGGINFVIIQKHLVFLESAYSSLRGDSYLEWFFQ